MNDKLMFGGFQSVIALSLHEGLVSSPDPDLCSYRLILDQLLSLIQLMSQRKRKQGKLIIGNASCCQRGHQLELTKHCDS